MPTPASANSPTAYTILDVDQNAYLFVGGIIGTVKVCVFPLRLHTATSTTCVYHRFCLLLSFRKQTQWEQQHSLAAWGRHSWTVNPSACGTTESDRETVKDVSSGEQTQAFLCCIIFSLLCNLLLWHFQTFQVEAAKQRNGNMFLFFFCSPQRSNGEGTVQLDGEGYAAVGRPTRWNPNVSTVTFKFRTFSSEALLMYLATEDMVCIQQSNKAETFWTVIRF